MLVSYSYKKSPAGGFWERLGAKHSCVSDGLEEVTVRGRAHDSVGCADDAGFHAGAFAGTDEGAGVRLEQVVVGRGQGGKAGRMPAVPGKADAED
jgi:hypothetical protein